MSARRAPQSTGQRRWSGLLVAVTVISLAGCSWRLETEPVDYPSPSETTLQRDEAAQREQSIVDALAGDTSSSNSALASLEATMAPQHLDAIGGVYVATPSPEPSPSPFLGPLDVAVAQARDGALVTAQSTTDDDLALLQSSIALAHAFALWWEQDGDLAASDLAASYTDGEDSASEASATPAPASERPLPTAVDLGELFTPESTLLPTGALGDLAVEHDKARFLYEVIAARATGTERQNALARRDVHAARAEALGTLAGDDDHRQVLYDVPRAEVDDAEARAATAMATEFALGATYSSLLDGVEPSDRGWLLNCAFDAYAAGALQPGFALAQFPALPGIEPTA